MNLRKHGLKVLGLSLMAALGLMAFSATGAQAVTHQAKILGKTFAELGIEEEAIDGKVDVAGALLVKGQNLSLKCPKLTVPSGKILLTDIDIEILFEICETFEFEHPSTKLPCLIDDDVKPGLVDDSITVDALVLFVLSGSIRYLLIEPLAGQNWITKIDFLDVTPGSCPLPDLVEIVGSLAVEITEGAAKELLVKEAPEAIQTALADKLKFGESKATIDGSGWVLLSGARAGCTWDVV
jgi:hypothetical protein